MGSPYVFEYRGEFSFPIPPGEMWAKLGQHESYERWFPWMRNPTTTGAELEPGSVIAFAIASPLPWKMHVTVEVVDSKRPERIDALVNGHLRGPASLRYTEEEGGTRAELRWALEVVDRSMRIGARVAGPLIRWGQDWGVRAALASFRRHLAAEAGADPASEW